LAATKEVILTGTDLYLEQVVRVARKDHKGNYARASLSTRVKEKLNRVRQYVDDNWFHNDAPPVYGFNTGVGPLKDTRISAEDNRIFQEHLINSHCGGVGDSTPEEVVRATMLIRANALSRGVSGIRLEVVERLLDMLNREVHPFIPWQGSVGASGDLAPLAYLVASLTGHPEAQACYRGEVMPAQDALTKAGLTPSFHMEAKDVLAMINGATLSLGVASLALKDALDLVEHANLAGALSMEAMRGEMDAFDYRLQQARNQQGQKQVAEDIRRILRGSQLVTDEARKIQLRDEHRQGPWKPRVQDAYSLRCIPQVHGASLDMIRNAREILEREMNAATDNPLIFPEEQGDGYQALSGGNFHGEYVAFAADAIAVAVHELGNISERRSARMLAPTLSFGLPPNLVRGKVGLNSGFPVVQCSASALVSENKTLCFPASADSIPTKANQEDHVSMSTWAASKLRQVASNTRKILAIEFLCACQGITALREQIEHLSPSPVTEEVFRAFREKVPAVKDDVFAHNLVREAVNLVENNHLIKILPSKE